MLYQGMMEDLMIEIKRRQSMNHALKVGVPMDLAALQSEARDGEQSSSSCSSAIDCPSAGKHQGLGE